MQQDKLKEIIDRELWEDLDPKDKCRSNRLVKAVKDHNVALDRIEKAVGNIVAGQSDRISHLTNMRDGMRQTIQELKAQVPKVEKPIYFERCNTGVMIHGEYLIEDAHYECPYCGLTVGRDYELCPHGCCKLDWSEMKKKLGR